MYPLKIFVIAGETSGDLLGGAILRAIAQISSRPLEVVGIGGDAIKSAGMKISLVPMHELAVMGIAEVLPKIFKLRRIINDTVEAIEGFKPDLILSIDAPDFSFRVQQKVRTRGQWQAKQIHVVAPSVWAWREGRAEKIAKFLDGLVCFFPFEPPYFEPYGLRCVAMGHPAINTPIAWVDPAPLRKVLDLQPDDVVVGLYLGSRAGVVERHAPTFIAAINQLAARHPKLRILIPTFPTYADRVRALCQSLSVRHHVMTDPLLKPVAMRACQYALAVSGTVGLELAIADVPHVVGYKMNALTWMIGQMMVKKGQFAHLANIVLNRAVVPECIQENCSAAVLAGALGDLIDERGARQAQLDAFRDVRRQIGEGQSEKPASKAATFILSRL